MSNNPADPIIRKDRVTDVAEENDTDSDYDGESSREAKVGVDREVVVDIFKRNNGSVRPGTYFARVSLRSAVVRNIILRAELELDRYVTEGDFIKAVAASAGTLAETDIERRGAVWDCSYVASQAQEAARELFQDLRQQG